MKNVVFVLITILLILILFPFGNIKWGKIEWSPAEAVTVNGEAKTKIKNQIATFTAGVSAVNDNKSDAVKEVNQKVSKLLEVVKNFGIKEEDIKTQNLNYYQSEETYWDNGIQKQRLGQWRVNNSIDITLRNVDKASELADILASSGANNVYGPNFSFDDTGEAEKGLMDEAIKNARGKAEIMAKSSNRKLGKILNVSEGSGNGNIYPMYRSEGMGGGGADVLSGSGTVSKTVTVVFELK